MTVNKVLIVIGWPINNGGHINSTLSLCKYLIRKGVKVYVFAPIGFKKNEFINYGIIYIKSPNNYWLSLIKIIKVILINNIRVLHGVDYLAIKLLIFVRIFFFRLIVYTKAGGEFKKATMPPVDSIIVFSKELYDKTLIHSYNSPSSIYLIKERIDIELYHPIDVKKDNKTIKVLIAMRLEPAKSKWLDSYINFIESYKNKFRNYSFIFAGSGSLFCSYKEKAQNINNSAGFELITLINDVKLTSEMCQLYNKSDLVIGHGRGIIEAMACGRNTAILGENGEIEIIDQKNLDTISYYNFSGRHFRLLHTKKNIDPLLTTNDKEGVNLYNIKYVEEEYNAEIGASKTITVYKQRKDPYLSFKILKWLFNERIL